MWHMNVVLWFSITVCKPVQIEKYKQWISFLAANVNSLAATLAVFWLKILPECGSQVAKSLLCVFKYETPKECWVLEYIQHFLFAVTALFL